MSFIEDYQNLLIKQYYEKDNAVGEIGVQAGTWEKCFNLLESFLSAFDVDTAVGAQLDIIGRVVGTNRRIPHVLNKNFFGFDDNILATGFGSLTEVLPDRATFYSIFSSPHSDLQLSDPHYRIFIKMKIAKNVTLGVMAASQSVSIVNVVFTAFNGEAYVKDNKDMSLTLYISDAIEEEAVRVLEIMDLLPKPQGVRYIIVRADLSETFGFDDNPESKGFANKFDLITEPGGEFAEKII